MRKSFAIVVISFLILTSFVGAEDHPALDLRSIPISDWLNAGESSQIPWNFNVRDPYLRVDQRLEVSYNVRISGKELNRTGDTHELFLISRISSPDGEWLNEPSIVRHNFEQLAKTVQAEFPMRVVVQPGDYILWSVLYDRKTGKHNVAKRRVKVSEIHGDPLPNLYSRMPIAEFPDMDESNPNGVGFVNSQLYLPVHNKRPLHIELISMLSPPEQWTGRVRAVRAHTDNTLGALAALSQINLAQGSLSITGLDLARRQVMFEQSDFQSVKWASLVEAMKKAQSLDISAAALQGSKNNGAFFREILTQRLADPLPGDATRVVIVVTSSQLFEDGSDLRPLQLEGDCNCRVYYLRFRLNLSDVFDQLAKFMKPLHPRVYDLLTARDLRNAISGIVGELEKL